MPLEKIVYAGKGDQINILNQDGTLYNHFDIDAFPWHLYQYKDKTIMNLGNRLACYDYDGNELWRREEFTSENNNLLNHNKEGMYVMHCKKKSDEFYNIWMGFVDYDGNLKWNKQIHLNAFSDQKPLINQESVVIQYSGMGSDPNQGIDVFNLQGDKVVSIDFKDMKGYPKALIDNIYVYQVRGPNATVEKGFFIEGYDIKKFQKKFSVETGFIGNLSTNGKQEGCIAFNGKVYLCTENNIMVLDPNKSKLISYDLPNAGLYLAGNTLIIPETYPKSKKKSSNLVEVYKSIMKGKISAYNPNMNKLWQHDLHQWIVDSGYSIHNCQGKSILISSSGNLIKIDKKGKQEWINTQKNYIDRVAIPIGY